LVKVRLVGFAVKVAGVTGFTGVTPAPDNAISTGVAAPLTIRDRLPLLPPAVVGTKRTPNVEA
jgi:hypothetical protein